MAFPAWVEAVAASLGGHRTCATRIRALTAECRSRDTTITHLRRLISDRATRVVELRGEVADLQARLTRARVDGLRWQHRAWALADSEATERRLRENAETLLRANNIPAVDMPPLPQQSNPQQSNPERITS